MNEPRLSQRSPEVLLMIVFLRDPLWINKTVTELRHFFAVEEV